MKCIYLFVFTMKNININRYIYRQNNTIFNHPAFNIGLENPFYGSESVNIRITWVANHRGHVANKTENSTAEKKKCVERTLKSAPTQTEF